MRKSDLIAPALNNFIKRLRSKDYLYYLNNFKTWDDALNEASKYGKAYEGDNVRGATVKSLIMNVIANNMVDDGRKIEVTGDIKLTGDEVPDSVETSKYYKVKCTMGSEGYINKVDITEKK